MPRLPEPGNNPIYPSGSYLVTIKSFEPTKASTGTPQIRWKAEIVEPLEYQGRPLTEHTALTDKSMWKVSNLIGGCGIEFQPNVDSESAYFHRLCQSCVGRLSIWRNTEGSDNKGNPRNNITAFANPKNQEVIKFTDEEETPAFLKDDKPRVW